MDKVKYELDVSMNCVNLGNHVTEIDQNNITVKERWYAQYHRLPFQNIPKVIIIYLDFEVFIKLNCSPVKGFLSLYYTPQTIMDKQPFDYKIH